MDPLTVTVKAARPARERSVEVPVSREFAARYALEAQLGHGAFGSVYRARRASDGALVAVKFLLEPGQPGAVEDFRGECEVLSRLDNLHVVAVHEVGVMGGHPYFVCDFVEGGTLADLLAAQRKLPVERAVEIALDVLKGLQAPHMHGIVHRDVKPANVLLTRSGRAVLADFGLAKPALIAAGERAGTPQYMAPEVRVSGHASTASDFYGVGVLLHECLTGRRPDEPFQPLEHVTPLLNEVLASALHPDREERPVTAADFIRELRLALREAEGPPPPAPVVRDASAELPWFLRLRYSPVSAVPRPDHDLMSATSGGETYAIRVARASAARARLTAEAACLTRLKHPNLVTLVESGRGYNVYEWLDGPSADEMGKVKPARAIALLIRLLDTLDALHKAGLMFRNLTARKLVESGPGKFKLVGLTRVGPIDSPREPLFGDFLYQAPEVLKGAAHTPRADLYAAGLIGYHLLAGKLPFRAARFAELLEQHDRGTFSKPSAHARISGYVDGLIVRALARDPERRWPDAATFREAAKEIAKGL